MPKLCSPGCRHRAWEHRRGEASGFASVAIRDRTITPERIVNVVEHHRIKVPVAHRPQSARDYAHVLDELAERLDAGRTYDRELATLTTAVSAVLEAMARHYR